MITSKKTLLAVGLLLALLSLGGCSMFEGWFGGDSNYAGGEAFDTPVQVLATEAEQLYNDGDFEESAELFQQLKDRFPYSRYALLADLRLGDAYFKAGRYDEAVLAYEDFIRLHPKNEAVPYAMYQIGMVFHHQMLGPERDPTNASKAAEAFRRLLRSYPKSDWSFKAKVKLGEALQRLAGHDMEVGIFYYESDQYKAAQGRFKRVLTQYPDVGLYREALEYLQKTETAMAEEEMEMAEGGEDAKAKREAEKDSAPFPGTEGASGMGDGPGGPAL